MNNYDDNAIDSNEAFDAEQRRYDIMLNTAFGAMVLLGMFGLICGALESLRVPTALYAIPLALVALVAIPFVATLGWRCGEALNRIDATNFPLVGRFPPIFFMAAMPLSAYQVHTNGTPLGYALAWIWCASILAFVATGSAALSELEDKPSFPWAIQFANVLGGFPGLVVARFTFAKTDTAKRLVLQPPTILIALAFFALLPLVPLLAAKVPILWPVHILDEEPKLRVPGLGFDLEPVPLPTVHLDQSPEKTAEDLARWRPENHPLAPKSLVDRQRTAVKEWEKHADEGFEKWMSGVRDNAESHLRFNAQPH